MSNDAREARQCFVGQLMSRTHLGLVAWSPVAGGFEGRYLGEYRDRLPNVRIRVEVADVGLVFATSRDAGVSWTHETEAHDDPVLSALLDTIRTHQPKGGGA